MKTIQERIDEIQVNGGNLCHIISTGKINGSLLTDIIKVSNEHADQEKAALKEKIIAIRNRTFWDGEMHVGNNATYTKACDDIISMINAETLK